jgi:hypothetical protein
VPGTYFKSARELDALHDELLADLVKLADRARQYYHRPDASGGGGSSFRDLSSIEKFGGSRNSDHGTFTIVAVEDESLILEGAGHEKPADGMQTVIRMLVTAERDSVISDSMPICR